MKKFKYPLIIAGAEQELKDLIPSLLELGYVEGSRTDMCCFGTCAFLHTGFERPATLGFSGSTSIVSEKTKTNIKDKELILTLAAMVDDDIYHEGELLYNILHNNFQKVSTLLGTRGSKSSWYRKATKEEIFKWYEDKNRPGTGDTFKIPINESWFGGGIAQQIRVQSELPEKWCIKRTPENYKVINEWFTSFGWRYMNNSGYLHAEGFTTNCRYCLTKIIGYTEITFEQFKNLVMKGDYFKGFNIIGYKLKPSIGKDSYSAILKANYIEDTASEVFTVRTYQCEVFKKLNLIDVWFYPIYEEEEKKEVTLEIGTGKHKVTIYKGSDRIRIDGAEETSKEQWSSLLMAPIQIGPWTANLTNATYRIGCEKEVTFLEVNKVISTWEELNK